MKLYEITSQFKELQSIDDMPPEAIADTLESLEGDFQEKAKAIVAVRSGMDADTSAIDAEIKRLQGMKSVIENRKKAIVSYLKTNMQAAGISKIECPLFKITLVKGREVLRIDDESAIPDDYMKVSTSIAPDKVQLLADLKAGTEISGCRIVRSDESLRIK